MKTLSEFHARVFFTIVKHGPVSPKQLSLLVGNKYDADSLPALVNRPIQVLLSKGLIKRNAVNSRVVTYEAVQPVPPLELRDSEPPPPYYTEMQRFYENP